MSFLSTLSKTVHPSAYISDLRKRGVSEGAWFLFLLVLIISFVIASYLGKLGYDRRDRAELYRDALFEELEKFYPADLILTWKDGELSTEAKQPLILDPQSSKLKEFLPASRNQDDQDKSIEHFVTVDTSGSVEDYLKYRSAILLTKKAAVIPDKNRATRVIFYNQTEGSNPLSNFVLDKAKWTLFAAAAHPFVVALPDYYIYLVIFLAIAAPIFIALCWTIWHLLYLIFFAFIAWIINAIIGRRYIYAELYVISLFASTIPIIFSTIFIACSIAHPPFFFSIVLLCVVVAVLLLGSETATSTLND